MDKVAAIQLFERCWPRERVVVTTRELVNAGLDSRAIKFGLQHGLLHRLRRGVYLPMHQWRDRRPWDKDKLVLTGHILATNGQYVYSHFSAARLHKLQVWDSSRLIHVSAPYRAAPSRTSQDVAIHFATLDPRDIVQRFIPGTGLTKFTALPRTVLQCAMTATFEQAVIIGDSALHTGLNLHDLEKLQASFHGCRGIKRARRVINSLNALSESAGETRTRLILAELPIELPELQVTLQTSIGTYRVDFAWQDIRLILEFDGETKYFEHAQSTEQALLEERERENSLIEDGWRFIRIKWKHLNNPEQLKDRIMKAYLAAQQAAA
ncbi:type IV toxin-antitoxin system AbiEi family antitoxin domain-containing protein [Arthrobacter sp.]|uniref:DUF559 domain-containing protein n=1 Tax=Arthrobacter sp. TaxID=1667 RepID=UPI0026DF96FF|nr:type IV toxin-antitoxin system AbiEi family antitoxin domain-containing protein [Arthrobacter sp.]MDO5752501.1 DUF559 domain-containing protein [Arthrobacter sp.]